MNRKEAKIKLSELKKQQEELQSYLDKTCRHSNKHSEETSCPYDYFKTYETKCSDCGKKLKE